MRPWKQKAKLTANDGVVSDRQEKIWLWVHVQMMIKEKTVALHISLRGVRPDATKNKMPSLLQMIG
jgi:hypothetical protein